MYKQRDNEYHPPMTVDPNGSGGRVMGLASPFGDAGGAPALEGSAVAAGSRKRGRDIRGINRFRTVVYGEDGFRRLHAMVARNPILMYPPDGIDAARARVMARRAELASAGPTGQPEEDDVFSLFEVRRRAEAAAGRDEEAEAEAHPPASSLAAMQQDEELSTYHQKQLDTYLRLLYEFNHVTFVKLPMEDTLQLLSRCGKEALAHVMDFETQLRLQRQSRIRDLNELREEQAELEERRRAAEAEEQARLLLAAEQRQAELELELSTTPVAAAAAESGVAEAMSVKPEMRDEDNEEEQKFILMDNNAAVAAAEELPLGPSVHFAGAP